MHFGFPHLIQHNFNILCGARARSRLLSAPRSVWVSWWVWWFFSSLRLLHFVVPYTYSFVVDTNQKTVRMNHSQVKRTCIIFSSHFIIFWICTQAHIYKYCICPILIHNFIIHLNWNIIKQYCVIISFLCALLLHGHWAVFCFFLFILFCLNAINEIKPHVVYTYNS